VRTATALAVITAVAVLAVVALGLGDAGVRLAGSNAAKLNAFVAAIPPDRALCQGGEVVPPSAGSLEIYTGYLARRETVASHPQVSVSASTTPALDGSR
jgi:hypothetical protein